MTELIKRLETAETGSRELDAEIAIHIGWKHSKVQKGHGLSGAPIWSHEWQSPDGHETDFERVSEFVQGNPEIVAADIVPTFSTNIDAALTLAPEGWSWRVGNVPSGGGFADLGTQTSLQCIEGGTPALALCIAALKAREQTNE